MEEKRNKADFDSGREPKGSFSFVEKVRRMAIHWFVKFVTHRHCEQAEAYH